jgi:hypothetical protein
MKTDQTELLSNQNSTYNTPKQAHTHRSKANLFTGAEDFDSLSEMQLQELLIFSAWPKTHRGPGMYLCVYTCMRVNIHICIYIYIYEYICMYI